MGVYTDHGLYMPDVGETGWGIPVDDNFDLLDSAVGGGGGGGSGLNLIDVTQSPFGGDPTGDTFSDTAIQNAFDAAFTAAPGSGVYLPGNFKVKTNLAHFETDGITVMGVPGGSLIVGDDMGNNPLFSCLGRTGYPDSQNVTGLSFVDITVDGSERAFRADAWADWWQSEDTNWTRCLVRDLKGAAILGTVPRRASLTSVRVINCGDGASGSPAIGFKHNDEGGFVSRVVEAPSMTDVWVTDSDDFAVLWIGVEDGSMVGCKLDGSGAFRSGFLGQDLARCSFVGSHFLNASETCFLLQSRGVADADSRSRYNVVTGCIAVGEGAGFYGFHEAAFNAGQTHFGNEWGTNVGTVQID